MQEIVVVSGKGGTGKTVVSAGLAVLSENKVLADCDVDASNLHLLLSPRLVRQEDFYSGKEYYRDPAKCNNCGKCFEICRFEAITDNYDIDTINCEGCAACYYVCPNKAISSKEKLAGYFYLSDTSYGKFVHAHLNPGEDNSGKLVTRVKKEARALGKDLGAEYLIIDGPPGIGCPVNAALTGSQTALIVTEPTLSGIHDLQRIIETCQRFRMRIFIVINKADLDQRNSDKIRELAQEQKIIIAGEIPYSEQVIATVRKGKSIVQELPEHAVSSKISQIWQIIKK